ncbi:alpha-L-rhamnosidase C-terminal domain-containing protein [Oribacterium sp. WCC10]|uniref:alpha-L-rhamnosidase C-terminal domain-containing protein n=1 Tax=Oribacterium sp. WCC10 TaxID=1855343 RepID=UPI0008E86C66|nr:alpha-L-rhamnosidase C-terminal domain-containing protein [Oribacterium sp. WCC10]SFG46018.1 hypothetical protein SAMN05216356_10991 [Oribacterium sp. WCC10]
MCTSIVVNKKKTIVGWNLDILVPANTEATVVLPGCENPVITGSGEWHYETVYKESGI